MCNDLIFYTNLDYDYKKCIEILNDCNADDFTKIFCILNLENIDSIDDMSVFISHLTNHNTPVREATAYKLEDIYTDSYFNEYIKQKLLDAITDINPNISRIICSVISKSNILKKELEPEIIARIENILSNIADSDIAVSNKTSHAKNKKIFSLYWLLESLAVVMSKNYLTRIEKILKFTIKFTDYTIREKTAKVLAQMPIESSELLQFAKADQNFYVKNQVYGKINFEE